MVLPAQWLTVSTLFLGFKVSSETAMMFLNVIVTLKSASLPPKQGLKWVQEMVICSPKQWSLSKTLQRSWVTWTATATTWLGICQGKTAEEGLRLQGQKECVWVRECVWERVWVWEISIYLSVCVPASCDVKKWDHKRFQNISHL